MEHRADYPHRSLLSSAMTVFAGSGAVNILNYLFTVVVGRLLSPIQFGEINALFSLQMITGVPSASVTMASAQFTGALQRGNQNDQLSMVLPRLENKLLRSALILLAVYLLAAPLIVRVFSISPLPVALFALLSAGGLCIALYQGVLQGRGQFAYFSLSNAIPTLAKLALGLTFVLLGWGTSGVMLALVIGAVAAAWYSRHAALSGLSRAQTSLVQHPAWSATKTYARTILMTNVLLALFMNADVLVAKIVLSPENAGQYAALTVVARIVTYGAGAFATVALPLMSAVDHARRRSLLWKSLILVVLISCAAASAFTLFPELAIRAVLGVPYVSMAAHLPGYAWAMAMGAVAMVLVNYLVSRQSRSVLYPLLAATLVEIIMLIVAHTSFTQFVAANVVANAILLLLLAGLASLSLKRHGTTA